MEPIQPIVLNELDVQREEWDDPVRGVVAFRTIFGGGTARTDSLTTGITDLPRGGWLGRHRHPPAEVYHVLGGHGVVCLEGVEHEVTAGSSVFIPGDAEHGIRNTGTEPLRFLFVFAADSLDDVEYRFSEA